MANETIKLSTLDGWYQESSNFYRAIGESKESSSGEKVGALLTVSKINKVMDYLNDLNYRSTTVPNKRVYYGYADWSDIPTHVSKNNKIDVKTKTQLDTTVQELKAICIANSVTNSQTGCSQTGYDTCAYGSNPKCITNAQKAYTHSPQQYEISGDAKESYAYVSENTNCNQYLWNMGSYTQNMSKVCTNCSDRASKVVSPTTGWNCADCTYKCSKTCAHDNVGVICSWTTTSQYAQKDDGTNYDRTFGSDVMSSNYKLKTCKDQSTCTKTEYGQKINSIAPDVTNSNAAHTNCQTYAQSGDGNAYCINNLTCKTEYIGYAVRADLTKTCTNLNETGCVQAYIRL